MLANKHKTNDRILKIQNHKNVYFIYLYVVVYIYIFIGKIIIEKFPGIKNIFKRSINLLNSLNNYLRTYCAFEKNARLIFLYFLKPGL